MEVAGPLHGEEDGVSDSAPRAASTAERRSLIAGMLVRRGQQAHTALWALCVHEDLSPPQYAILRVLSEGGWTDQKTLGQLAALDRSNAAEMLSRLALRQLVQHRRDDTDRRRKLWALTDPGQQLFRRAQPSAAVVNELLLAPLGGHDRDELLRLLDLLVTEAERRVDRMQAERSGPGRAAALRPGPGSPTAD